MVKQFAAHDWLLSYVCYRIRLAIFLHKLRILLEFVILDNVLVVKSYRALDFFP